MCDHGGGAEPKPRMQRVVQHATASAHGRPHTKIRFFESSYIPGGRMPSGGPMPGGGPMPCEAKASANYPKRRPARVEATAVPASEASSLAAHRGPCLATK